MPGQSGGQPRSHVRFSRQLPLATQEALEACFLLSYCAGDSQMPRLQPKSRFNFLTRGGLPWLAVILWFSLLFPIAGRAVEATVTNTATTANMISDATNHIGCWIWDTITMDKQTCRFWKSFEIPRDVACGAQHGTRLDQPENRPARLASRHRGWFGRPTSLEKLAVWRLHCAAV